MKANRTTWRGWLRTAASGWAVATSHPHLLAQGRETDFADPGDLVELVD